MVSQNPVKLEKRKEKKKYIYDVRQRSAAGLMLGSSSFKKTLGLYARSL